MIMAPLRHFAATEFRHPELVDNAAAVWLDDIRDLYGFPLTLTSDARSPEENAAASGSSPTSLHLLGRAFDLQWIDDPEHLWSFVEAVYLASGDRAVELELVHGAGDHHLHIGLFPDDGHHSRLLVQAD
jgi:Peptidase M15